MTVVGHLVVKKKKKITTCQLRLPPVPAFAGVINGETEGIYFTVLIVVHNFSKSLVGT